MMLRNVVKNTAKCRAIFSTSNNHGIKHSFNYSTSEQVLVNSLDLTTGIATLKLTNPPVNCLSTKLIQQWLDALASLEQDKKCTAIILASSIPEVFCAGLDFKEIHRPQREQYLNYHRLAAKIWSSMYTTRLPTVAAVNGSSTGFGCIFAMSCDYRIMKSGKGTIGLPEVHLGIPVTSWMTQFYQNMVGRRQAELGLSRGLMYRAEDALRIGLVDEVASSEEELLKQATNQAKLLAEIPSEPRHYTKMLLRQPLLDLFWSTVAEEEERIADAVMSQKLQARIDVYLEKLKKNNRI